MSEGVSDHLAGLRPHFETNSLNQKYAQPGSTTDHHNNNNIIDIEQNLGNMDEESHSLSGKSKTEKKGKKSNSSRKNDNASIPVKLTRKLSARPSFYKKYNFKDSIGYKIRKRLIIVEKKIGPFVKRVIPNFIVAHYVYIISLSIIGSILLYPQKNIPYVDALFIASCASTQAGLTTVDINSLKLYQQIVIYMITMLTTPIFIHSFLVIIRLYWFEQQFDNIKEKSKLNFQMRRTATLANMRTARTLDSVTESGFAPNFTNKLNFFKIHTKKDSSSDSNTKVTEGSSNEFFENLSAVDPRNTSPNKSPSPNQIVDNRKNRRSSSQGFGTHNASEELNRRLNRAAVNNNTTPPIQEKSNPDSQSTADSSLEDKEEGIELENLNNHISLTTATNQDSISDDEDDPNNTVLHLSEPSDSESDTEIRPIENTNYSNKTQPLSGQDEPNIHESENTTTDKNTNSISKNNTSKDIKFANLPKPSRRKEMDPGELYMSISMLQHNKRQSQVDVESGPALVIKGPAERSRKKLPGHDRRLKKLHKLRKLHKQQRQKMKEAEEKEERLLLQEQQREQQQRRRSHRGFETDYFGNFLHENSTKIKNKNDAKESFTEGRRPSLIGKDSKFSRPNILRRLSHGMIGTGSGSVMTISNSTKSTNEPSTDEKQTNINDTQKQKFGNESSRSSIDSIDSNESEMSDSRTNFSRKTNGRDLNSLADSIHSMNSIDSILSVHSEPVLEQSDNEVEKHHSNSSVKPLLKVQSHVPKSSEKVANFKRALTGEFPSDKKSSSNKNSKTINFDISDNRNHDYQYTKQGVRPRRDSRRRQSKSLNRKRPSLPAKLIPTLSFNGLTLTASNNSVRSKSQSRRNGATPGATGGGNEHAVESDYSSEEDGYDDTLGDDDDDNDEEDDNYSLDSRYNMSTNYLSWNPTVGRNSTFVFMNDAQKEELGGVEYRALKLLGYILVIYYIGFHIICFVLVVPYILTSKKYSDITRESGVSPTWWSFFNAASFFNDLGYSLNPTSLVPFNQCAFILIVSSVFIVIGNTGFPIFLRFIIWIMFKFSTPLTLFQESLAFLLDHPRRCFTLLFPAGPTWWLFAVLVFLNCTDWVLFLILDFHSDATDGIPYGYRAFEGLFQAFSTRTAGFNVIDLSLLHPAIQVSYMVMMYISVLPLALSIRRTNVYEEQSLGIYNNDDDVEEPTDSKRSFIGSHFRRQLSFDLWFVFLGLFIICIAEGGRLQSGDPRFTVFTCLFEVISAYGTVGLSLGYPTVNSSLATEFSVISKLVIIAMVIRGRHRGLPYSVDRAIMLARESVDMRDEYEASQAFRRTQTMQRFNSANSIGTTHPSEMTTTGVPVPTTDGINNRKFSRSETLSRHARRAASVASNLAKTVLLMNHKDVITPSHTMDFRRDFTFSSRNPMDRQDTSFTHESFDRRSHPGEQISNLNIKAHQYHNHSSYHDDMEEIDEIPSEENGNEESADSEHKSFQDFIQRKRETSEAKSK